MDVEIHTLYALDKPELGTVRQELSYDIIHLPNIYPCAALLTILIEIISRYETYRLVPLIEVKCMLLFSGNANVSVVSR